MKKSLILAKILLGTTILFSGCGGGGSSTTTSLSTVSGKVSDGPIKNVRVFLDINNDGVYNEGEPYDITDSKGEYSIQYILKPGLEYVLIAEGSTALNTEDTTTDNTGLLNFTMFLNVKVDGEADATNIVGKTYTKDVTPITFKKYVSDLYKEDDTLSIFNNTYINELATTTSTDKIAIFQDIILQNAIDNPSDDTVTVLSGTISTNNDTKISAANTSENIYIIPDDVPELKSLKDSIVTGDLTEKISGISSLIDTNVAFDIMNSYVNTSSVTVDANGIKKTIKYTKKDNIITAVFKETINTTTDTAEYEGTVIFKLVNSTSTLLNANYTQKHTQVSNLNVKNKVNGVIEISNVNSIYTLNLKNGIFSINTPLYGDVEGDVTIKGATTLDPSTTLYNDNTIETTTVYTLKTKVEPTKDSALYPASLVGTWSGSFTDSCTTTTARTAAPSNTMTLSVSDEFTGSWQAQSSTRTYGTKLTVLDSNVTFKDNITTSNTTWSIGTILNNQITGTWNDTLNKCTGTYTLNKLLNEG